MFSDNVRDNIELEIKRSFDRKDVMEVVSLYERVVFFPVLEDGVSRELKEALESYFAQSGNIRQSHKVIANIEPFLRKLLMITNRSEYDNITNDHGLSRIMKVLGLLDGVPNRIKRLLVDPEVYAKIDESDSITNKTIVKALFKSYQIRNLNSHESEEWSVTEIAGNINSVLLTSCYAVWINKEAVETAIQSLKNENYDFDIYAKGILASYENEMKNGFKYVPLIWARSNSDNDEKFDVKKLRVSNDNRVMLVGEAGCGKTTLLNYLEYCDAKAYVNCNKDFLPVKISLIEENYRYQNIEEFICNKLNIPLDYCKQLLNHGSINLYLDGLNEIISDVEVKKSIALDIEKFCEMYPKTAVVVTDRPYTVVKLNIPNTYRLRKMSREDIIHYASSQKAYNALVESKIEMMLDAKEFSDYEYTPIFINQLVEIFSQGMEVPKDEHDLLDSYLNAIFTREYNEKKDYNAAPGRTDLLLTELPNLEKIEEGVHFSKVLRFFVEKAKEYGLSVQAEECLNLALQLGVLKKQGDYIQFYSNEYLTYYLMKSMEL